MKRYSLLIFCVLMCLALAACKKPVGGTPYESTDAVDSSSIVDDNQSDVLGSDSSVLPDDGDSNSTTKGTAGRGTTTTTVGNNNEVELDWGEPEPTVVTDSKGNTVTDNKGQAVTVTTTTTMATTTTQPTKQEVVKGISLPKKGYRPDTNLELSSVTVDKNNKVTMVIKNITTKWESDQSSYFEYTCYNEKGKTLCTEKLPFGRINAGKSVTVQFTIPKDTEKVELTKYVAEFWSDGWN